DDDDDELHGSRGADEHDHDRERQRERRPPRRAQLDELADHTRGREDREVGDGGVGRDEHGGETGGSPGDGHPRDARPTAHLTVSISSRPSRAGPGSPVARSPRPADPVPTTGGGVAKSAISTSCPEPYRSPRASMAPMSASTHVASNWMPALSRSS